MAANELPYSSTFSVMVLRNSNADMKREGLRRSDSAPVLLISTSRRAMSDAINVTARYTGVLRSAFDGVTTGIGPLSAVSMVDDHGPTKRRWSRPRNIPL